jgi:hypothetical protein
MAARIKLDGIYDVDDLALETGATVESPDGRKFNSAGVVAKRKPVVAPAPEPEVEDEDEGPEPPHPEVLALLKQLVEVVKRPVEVTIPPIPAPQVTVKAAEQKVSPPKAWTFDFERNPNGTIKRINAVVKD